MLFTTHILVLKFVNKGVFLRKSRIRIFLEKGIIFVLTTVNLEKNGLFFMSCVLSIKYGGSFRLKSQCFITKRGRFEQKSECFAK